VPTYDALQNKKNALIRKPLDGSSFLRPYGGEGSGLDRITDTNGNLVLLPDLWDDLGYLTNDGMQQAREVSQSDVTSFGRQTPTRTDITSDVTTVTVAAQETKITTIGLATGFDMAKVQPLAGGEVVLRKPARPTPRTYSMLNLAVDLHEAGEIYIARYYPKAKVTGFLDQPFGGGDDPILWGTTLTAEFDDALGFSEAWFFGGPGWRALLTEMGFPAEAAAA